MLDKPTLRRWAQERRAALDMPVLSHRLIDRIRDLPEFSAASDVLIYLAMPEEINVEGLIENADGGKRWYVPRCAPRRRLAVHRYVPGHTPLRLAEPFSIREPDPSERAETDPSALELVIVPGLCFSERGDRLGYGGGYYDRFLPQLESGCVRVGALPEALILPMLPTDPWDQPLDIVLTESAIFRPGADRRRSL